MADLSQGGTYTYDLTTAVGQLRLMIGDIIVNNTAFYADEEITYMLNQNNDSVPLAAIAALENWARRLASTPKKYIGDYQEDPTVAAKSLAAQAVLLRNQLQDESDDVVAVVAGGTRYYEEDGWRYPRVC